MSFGFVQSMTATGTSPLTMAHFNTNPTAGNAIIVGIAVGTAAANRVSSVTDSASNTYYKASDYASTASDVELWYATGITSGGATHQVTVVSQTGDTIAFVAQEWSGLSGGSLLDVYAANSGIGTALNSGATSSTANASELVFGVASQVGTRPFTAGSGYGNFDQNTGSSAVGVAMESLATTSAGAQTATMSIDLSQSWSLMVVALKASGSSSATHSVTKSLQYAVRTSTAKTKGLKYAVTTFPAALTKSARYEVSSVRPLTKGLKYALSFSHSASKSLRYAVSKASSLTKGISYHVSVATPKTKGLKYAVTAPRSATKAAKYAVTSARQASKALSYRMTKTPSALTKSLQYVLGSGSVDKGKSLKYSVKVVRSGSKALSYRIFNAVSIPKGLGYKVRSPHVLAKGLSYRTVTGRPIAKALAYHTLKSVSPTKQIHYSVRAARVSSKQLEYAIGRLSSPSKNVRYSVRTVHTLPRQLSYFLDVPTVPTLPSAGGSAFQDPPDTFQGQEPASSYLPQGPQDTILM